MYDATLRIAIFGDFFEERQALFDKFLTNLFVSDQTMTIGVDFKVKSLTVDGQKVKLQVKEFRDDERFRFLIPTYMRAVDGGLFVYDVTNYSSLAHIDNWLIVIRKEIRTEDRMPIVVVGIVPDEMCERQVSTEEGIRIAKSRGVSGYIEFNLTTGKNVEKAFEALARLMLSGKGYEKSVRVKVKVDTKDEEYLITYTRNLEKKVRNLEKENLILENQIKQLKFEKQVVKPLKKDLDSLQNKLDKYKKMGI